eukprot:gene18721-25248_t
MMNDDDDFSDAKNFVQEDEEEGKVDEVDETDQKIAVEHGIFKEKEARRWEARPGSAPPLMSPRPETIRQREEERLAAAGNPPPSGKGGDEAGEWVVDVEEDEEEAEVVKEDGEGEEGDQGVELQTAASQGTAPIIVVPTGTGRSPSPDVGRKLGGYDQGNNDLEDSEDLFEDDEGSDPLDDSSVRGSEATTDFGEVLHPHNFAMPARLPTPTVRAAAPSFQRDRA